MRMGVLIPCRRNARQTSSPSGAGIMTSRTIASYGVVIACSMAVPPATTASTVTYNKPLTAHSTDPSFIAQNASREYQSIVGVEGTLDFGLRAAVRRSRELLAAAHAGTEVARRELLRSVRESYFGLALATAK